MSVESRLKTKRIEVPNFHHASAMVESVLHLLPFGQEPFRHIEQSFRNGKYEIKCFPHLPSTPPIDLLIAVGKILFVIIIDRHQRSTEATGARVSVDKVVAACQKKLANDVSIVVVKYNHGSYVRAGVRCDHSIEARKQELINLVASYRPRQQFSVVFLFHSFELGKTGKPKLADKRMSEEFRNIAHVWDTLVLPSELVHSNDVTLSIPTSRPKASKSFYDLEPSQQKELRQARDFFQMELALNRVGPRETSAKQEFERLQEKLGVTLPW